MTGHDLHSPTPPLGPRALARWLWQLTKDVVKEFQEDGVGDLAASITFWTIVSIPAAALALVSALSSLDSVVGSSLAEDVEAEVQEIIRDTLVDSQTLANAVDELFNSTSAGVATVATAVAIFTLSRAFAGLIRALDVAYEVEEGRPFWYVRIVAIGLGLATIVVVAATATFLALLPSLPLSSLVRFLTAPVAFGVLIAWAATLFHVGPNHKTPWKYDLPGAIVTAVGWLLTSQGYALYVRLAAGGNEVQTGVGAILLALTLMWLLSVVLLVGAEVNDIIARRSGVVQDVAPVTQRARWLRDRYRPRR
ncbi:MAG: YihY/virulence factor BrkB family protein [Ilumatobacter sp.]|nr:YihY/virulence factor BrkB family protein [Ilumatobacter sp.]